MQKTFPEDPFDKIVGEKIGDFLDKTFSGKRITRFSGLPDWKPQKPYMSLNNVSSVSIRVAESVEHILHLAIAAPYVFHAIGIGTVEGLKKHYERKRV